jgi:hypothetical protein
MKETCMSVHKSFVYFAHEERLENFNFIFLVEQSMNNKLKVNRKNGKH